MDEARRAKERAMALRRPCAHLESPRSSMNVLTDKQSVLDMGKLGVGKQCLCSVQHNSVALWCLSEIKPAQ